MGVYTSSNSAKKFHDFLKVEICRFSENFAGVKYPSRERGTTSSAGCFLISKYIKLKHRVLSEVKENYRMCSQNTLTISMSEF